MQGSRRRAWTAIVACSLLAAVAPEAARGAEAPALDWQPCGEAANVTCATAAAPLDYDSPGGPSISLFVARSPATDQAHRIGSLFINFGGPGGTTADILEAFGADLFPALNTRYDIIGMDPRGVGQSEPSIDCKVNQETEGIYSVPFPTPLNLDVPGLVAKDQRYVDRCVALNRAILPHVSTANVARDIDLLRRALDERKITYFGYSYGTLLGATYASLFPRRYRAMVLDGPVDATDYINDPTADLSAQSDGFERALARFFQACAVHQDVCQGFGGEDPASAFDELVDQADETPIPAGGDDPRPVTGDDILFGATGEVYAKQFWPELAQALADLAKGDGTLMRRLVDESYGRNPDGTFDPGGDRYFTIGAIEQRYERGVKPYLRAGKRSWSEHEHTWWNNGYVELNYGLWPIRDEDAFAGPFRIPGSSVTPLVVATRYDPATPYRGALSLVHDLGNARLLTMIGDGHTAYPGNSACVDAAVEAYLDSGALPAAGTRCRQEVPFAAAPAPAAAGDGMAAVSARRSVSRHGMKPLPELR